MAGIFNLLNSITKYLFYCFITNHYENVVHDKLIQLLTMKKKRNIQYKTNYMLNCRILKNKKGDK